MRLKDKVAIIVGAGQGPGAGMGNGRATVLVFAREGAKVLAVDLDLKSAEETAAMVAKEGGTCIAFAADVTKEPTLKAAVDEAVKRWGRVDVLHNNVGVSLAGGDANPLEITEAAFDRISAINLRGTVMACKHVLPVMRAATLRRHRQHFLGGSLGDQLSNRRLQDHQGGDDRLHRADRHAERRVRHPLQCHSARPDGYADGG